MCSRDNINTFKLKQGFKKIYAQIKICICINICKYALNNVHKRGSVISRGGIRKRNNEQQYEDEKH